MNTSCQHKPVEHPFMTPVTWVLIAFTVVGVIAILFRFIGGLGMATNLNDHYPWGIWKGVGVAAFMALATGGFITAALVHVFHRERYDPLVRPALLIALLGYTLGQASLFIDLGRYYNIWHPAWPTMWQGNSMLFEVAICVMAYSTVMWLEFLPVICEQFRGRVNLPGALARLNTVIEKALSVGHWFTDKTLGWFLVAGIVLSCMHHSSLGGLMLIARYKIHPLWYTPVLPLLFLLSIFPAGLSMVVLVCLPLRRKLEHGPADHLFVALSRYILLSLGIYGLAKISDILIRDAYVYLLEEPRYLLLWGAEFVLGILLPLLLLVRVRQRKNTAGLATACGLVVFGLIFNRINVFLTTYQSQHTTTIYFPSLVESLITVGLLAGFALLFMLAIRFLPIWPQDHKQEETRPAI